MGKRKLRFDVRKNSERKRQCQVHDIQCPIEEPLVVKVSLDIYYSAVASNLHILWKRLSNFKPPSGFYVTSIQREGKVTSLMICRDDGEFPCVITINCDFSWSFTINTVVLSLSKIVPETPEKLISVTAILNLLIGLGNWSLCSGNPDEKFTTIKDTRKGVFKYLNGKFLGAFMVS